jgi:hypothetical protein
MWDTILDFTNMQWSKLRSRVKDLICPELRDRIDFHVTSYRGSHDGADKVWITVDRERVFAYKHYPYEWAERQAYYDGLKGDKLKEVLLKNEIHGPTDFGKAMRAYLDMPIDDALVSVDPLVRAFSIVDRRLGKRALEKLQILDSEHTLVKAFYELRHIASHNSSSR